MVIEAVDVKEFVFVAVDVSVTAGAVTVTVLTAGHMGQDVVLKVVGNVDVELVLGTKQLQALLIFEVLARHLARKEGSPVVAVFV